MSRREGDDLLDLAASILDGTGVDWREAEIRASGEERPLLQSLELLSRISDLHRRGASPVARWGSFELRALIGRGSHGDVHRAWDTRLHREVALKLLRPSLETRGGPGDDPPPSTESGFLPFEEDAEGPSLRRRWLAEARRLAAVRHPNLVTVHLAEEFDGVAGIAMELVQGRTLESRLASEGPAGAGELASIGMELCRALAALHNAGLLHHDVKASNVMREEGGRFVLMDLGVGGATPLYMAPELFQGSKATQGSDLYALGVLLHHLATGSYPVYGATVDALRAAHASSARASLRDARPDLPSALVQAIERAHAASPEERFDTAGALEAALAATLTARARPRHGGRVRRFAPVVVLGLLACALVYFLSRGARPRPPDAADLLGVPPGTASGSMAGGGFSMRATFLRGTARSPIGHGDALAVGDSLALEVEASESLFVYVVNEDARGHAFLLFPLRGLEPSNPLFPDGPHALPGTRGGRRFYWQVTSAGERERMILIASRRRLVGFESDALLLERAREGRQVEYPRVTEGAIAGLRGLGGLVGEGSSAAAAPAFGSLGDAPILLPGWQEGSGVLIRRIEFANRPARRTP